MGNVSPVAAGILEQRDGSPDRMLQAGNSLLCPLASCAMFRAENLSTFFFFGTFVEADHQSSLTNTLKSC